MAQSNSDTISILENSKVRLIQSKFTKIIPSSVQITHKKPLESKSAIKNNHFPHDIFSSRNRRKKSQVSLNFLENQPDVLLNGMRKLRGDCVEIMKHDSLPVLPFVNQKFQENRIGISAGGQRKRTMSSYGKRVACEPNIQNFKMLNKIESAGSVNQVLNLRAVARPGSRRTYLNRIHEAISNTIAVPLEISLNDIVPRPPEDLNIKVPISVFNTTRRKIQTESSCKIRKINNDDKENKHILQDFSKPILAKHFPRPALIRRKFKIICPDNTNNENSPLNVTFGGNNKLINA